MADTTETTGSQVTTSYGGQLVSPLSASYATYRAMRKHPTIGLARALVVAPVLAGEWSVESRDDATEEQVEMVKKTFLPIREQVLETALLGGIDFGWAPFEKVFELVGGRVHLRKLKSLLQDITEIQVDGATGAFAGFTQRGTTRLPLDLSFLVSFRVEGTQWHGQALLENARGVHDEWVAANAGAARYDAKIAGSHFVVYYPPGTSPVNGEEKDNGEIAADLLAVLESSGSISVPTTVATYVDELAETKLGWRIEILEDRGGRQPTFIDRLGYLDVQMVRAMLIPERAVLEGKFGTKAEAGAHADLALTQRELEHRHVTRYVNWHVVDQLLALNWGEEARGAAWLACTPLVDEALAFLRMLYTAMLKNPAGFVTEFPNIDAEALRQSLSIPSGGKEERFPPLPGLENPSGEGQPG